MSETATRRAVDVDIRHVDLSYGSNHVLKNVNLNIKPGEFFAFLGPSGCGKTTLLRLIAGFNVADRGEVLIGGSDVAPAPMAARCRHGVSILRFVAAYERRTKCRLRS